MMSLAIDAPAGWPVDAASQVFLVPIPGVALEPSVAAAPHWQSCHQPPCFPDAALVQQQQQQQPAQQPLQPVQAGAALAGGACSAAYQQCGGVQWTGPTCCAEGSTCTQNGDYYSQCTPSAGAFGGVQQSVGALAGVDSLLGIMKKDDESRADGQSALGHGGRRTSFGQAALLFATVPLLIAAAGVACRRSSGRPSGGFLRLPGGASRQELTAMEAA